MKRATTVLALGALLLAGCTGEPKEREEPPLWITVESEDWNGWDPNYESLTFTEYVAAVPGNEAPITSLLWLVIRIESVEDGVVTFSTNEPLTPVLPGGGYDVFDSDTHEFTISLAEPRLELATPSFDAGFTHLFALTRDRPSGATPPDS